MGLFDWGRDDTFEVNFGGVVLDGSAVVETGEDLYVDAEVRTEGGSDTYHIEDTQLYLETGEGTYFLDRQSMENPVGGAIDRSIPFRFQVDGARITGLVEDGVVEPGEAYGFRTYTIFRAFEGEQIDDYWDSSSERVRLG